MIHYVEPCILTGIVRASVRFCFVRVHKTVVGLCTFLARLSKRLRRLSLLSFLLGARPESDLLFHLARVAWNGLLAIPGRIYHLH